MNLNNGNEIKGGVLIVGSLLWENRKNAINKEQGKLRTKWRTKLDLESKIAVDVPIRYGRRSGSRRRTYTMVFSNSSELGIAYIVPYKDGISSFADLKTQAIELAYAEGISSCKYLNAYMQNPSGYKREREGFTFDEQANAYTCSQELSCLIRARTPAATTSIMCTLAARWIARSVRNAEPLCKQ